MLRPFRRQRPRELHDGGFGSVVRTLLLQMKDASAGDGGDEDHGSTCVTFDHVAGAGLGNKEGAR